MKTIRIDPRGKYILIPPDGTTPEEAKMYADSLMDWWGESGTPMIVAGAKFQIIKVGGPTRWLNSLLITLRLKKS